MLVAPAWALRLLQRHHQQTGRTLREGKGGTPLSLVSLQSSLFAKDLPRHLTGTQALSRIKHAFFLVHRTPRLLAVNRHFVKLYGTSIETEPLVECCWSMLSPPSSSLN